MNQQFFFGNGGFLFNPIKHPNLLYVYTGTIGIYAQGAGAGLLVLFFCKNCYTGTILKAPIFLVKKALAKTKTIRIYILHLQL